VPTPIKEPAPRLYDAELAFTSHPRLPPPNADHHTRGEGNPASCRERPLNAGNELMFCEITEGGDAGSPDLVLHKRTCGRYSPADPRAEDQPTAPLVRPLNRWPRKFLKCVYRFASFVAGDHRCTVCGGEPSRPPVPIACNAKKRRSDHNANQGCVNEYGYRQRKSEHLNH
jgi:hypothetical protein